MGLAAGAFFIFQIEQTIAERREALRAFDAQARGTVDRLADLRAGQQAYVAAGQGVGFWMPKVAALGEAVAQSVDQLRSRAVSGESRAALMEAGAAITELGNVDRRARDYLDSDQHLMAADVVFAEATPIAAGAALQVEGARQTEYGAFAAFESTRRRQQMLVAAAATGVGALALAFLAFVPAGANDEPLKERVEPAVSTPTQGSELGLRDALPEAAPAKAATGRHELLRQAAAICTEFSRVNDADELEKLLAKAADAMDARGIIVWQGDTAGSDLRPIMAYGYTPQTLARMPIVPRSAGNATASAYRSAQMQIVRSRPGASSGAVAAPMLSQAGCVGALTAEINGGGEESDAIQSLAAIFAAQLANVVGSAAAVESEPAIIPEARSASA
jgi:hypothetical protein